MNNESTSDAVDDGAMACDFTSEAPGSRLAAPEAIARAVTRQSVLAIMVIGDLAALGRVALRRKR